MAVATLTEMMEQRGFVTDAPWLRSRRRVGEESLTETTRRISMSWGLEMPGPWS